MFGSQILEVVIGLILVYLLLSIASSGIKEFLAGIMNMRSKTLEEGIRKMLQDPGNGLADQLFNHPLIAGTAEPGRKPSYISARNFALALLDLLAPPQGATPRTVADLQNGIANLPDARLRKLMLGFVETAQGNVELARARIEGWFNDTMDRVSGWYKRKAQAIIFVVGLVLCASLNGDTFMIVRELWNDEALRTTVLSSAQARVQQGAQTPENSLKRVQSDIREAGSPPIGWHPNDVVRGMPLGWNWLLKVLGILVSAVAITLGAPFWFDLLNKVINLRITGAPPPETTKQ